jgi:hypothetical protein
VTFASWVPEFLERESGRRRLYAKHLKEQPDPRPSVQRIRYLIAAREETKARILLNASHSEGEHDLQVACTVLSGGLRALRQP